MTTGDLLDYALHYLMRVLPIDACSGLGAALSPWLGRRANPVADARARALLLRLAPALAADPAATEARLAGLWRATGRTFAEFAAVGRIVRAGRARLDGVTALDEAFSSGRPVIVTFPHTGNWEVSLAQVALRHPHRLLVVVDLPKRVARARIATVTRARLPIAMVESVPGMWRHALAQLSRPGGVVFLAADGQEGGVCRFPAFGGPTPPGGSAAKLVRLARRAGALILPLHCERVEGAQFLTCVQPAYDPSILSLEEAIAVLDGCFEPIVRRLADQWYMALMYPSDHTS